MNHSRTRAWRRHQRERCRLKQRKLIDHLRKSSRARGVQPLYKKKKTSTHQLLFLPKSEKKWSFLYLRSRKLKRAKQLAMLYPISFWNKELDEAITLVSMNILFICSRNQWRSPTAEAVWRKFPGLSVRSAGTSPKARKTVTAADIRWSDIIFAMEPKHKQRLQADFQQVVQYKRIEVLDIPDEYRYMDPALVKLFEAEAEAFLDR